MVVAEYWTERALNRIESVASYISDMEERLDDTVVEDSLEVLEGFQYVEGEIIEYDGERHEVKERDPWLSLMLMDRRYQIEDSTGYTKTVFEDDML